MKPRVEEAEAMAFILQHQFLHHAEDIIMDKTTEEKSVFFLFLFRRKYKDWDYLFHKTENSKWVVYILSFVFSGNDGSENRT